MKNFAPLISINYLKITNCTTPKPENVIIYTPCYFPKSRWNDHPSHDELNDLKGTLDYLRKWMQEINASCRLIPPHKYKIYSHFGLIYDNMTGATLPFFLSKTDEQEIFEGFEKIRAEVEETAYFMWLDNHCPHNKDLHFWQQACDHQKTITKMNRQLLSENQRQSLIEIDQHYTQSNDKLCLQRYNLSKEEFKLVHSYHLIKRELKLQETENESM